MKMTVKQFAMHAGVTTYRCEPEWGGTWAYKTADAGNVTMAGYKTELDALQNWLNDAFGDKLATTVRMLLTD